MTSNQHSRHTPESALALLRDWEQEFPGLVGVADAVAGLQEQLEELRQMVEEREGYRRQKEDLEEQFGSLRKVSQKVLDEAVETHDGWTVELSTILHLRHVLESQQPASEPCYCGEINTRHCPTHSNPAKEPS